MTLGTAEADGRPWVSPDQDASDVLAPSLRRLYRATVSQHWVLDPGVAPDQRTTVNP